MDFHSICLLLLGTPTSTPHSGRKHGAEFFSPFTIRTKRMHIAPGEGRQISPEARIKGKSKVLQGKNVNNTDDPFI